jgi:septum site-determining protein MinC
LKATRRVAPASIRLRGTTVPVIAVMLRDADPQRLEQELQQKIDEASGSLSGGLGVIDVCAIASQPLDLAALAALVRRLGLHPVAVQGADATHEEQARTLGLAVLPAEPASARPVQPIRQVAEPAAPADPPRSRDGDTSNDQPRSALVVSTPLRSGQRIYARDRDLVLLSSSSPGSELIADGHIHCYGPLRGRAVAGASGDTSAQVFALDFHAELVSIAGVYKAFEALPPDVAGKPVRLSLRPDGEHPHIDVAPLT